MQSEYNTLNLIGIGIPTSGLDAVIKLSTFFFGHSLETFTDEFELKTSDSETIRLLKQNEMVIFLLKSIVEL